VSVAVVLDSTPLGLLCHPRQPPPVVACRQWITHLLAAGRRVIVPEIADYEVRREFFGWAARSHWQTWTATGLNLSTFPLRRPRCDGAAELWSQARTLVSRRRPPLLSMGT